MAKYSKPEYWCAQWLAYCLSIGWDKSDLDELQRIWWQYHPLAKRARTPPEKP